MASSFLRWLLSRPFGLTYSDYRALLELFDLTFYCGTQVDVASAGVDPFTHYFLQGWREGRNPSRQFNTIFYLHANPEAARLQINPLIHYVQEGRHSGRSTSPSAEESDSWRDFAEFNPLLPSPLRAYVSDYNVLKKADSFDARYVADHYNIGEADPFEYFLRYSNEFGINPNTAFDTAEYLRLHVDVRQSGCPAFVHYLRHGFAERRALRFSVPSAERAISYGGRSYFGLEPSEQDALSKRCESLPVNAPLISVVVPVYNTEPAFLNACVQSILSGAYRKIELILVDDASPRAAVRENLLQIARDDERVKLVLRSVNGNISAATNDGLQVATGDFVAFVDHDDELTPDALLCISEAIVDQPKTDIWYSDQLKCDANGVVFEHFYKPDWSPTYALGVMYIGHLLVVRRTLVPSGVSDSAFDGVQDFEMMLRLSENTQNIGHISKPLYKWRAIKGSLAAGVGEKSGIEVKQKAAVEAHFSRLGRNWKVNHHSSLPHRLVISAAPWVDYPLISIIIPSKNQGEIVTRCLDSLFELTRYPRFEVVVVDNGTTDPLALETFSRLPIKVVDYSGAFNFSDACNRGVAASNGELIVFLNNDTEVISGNWLSDLALFFDDEHVGAVGPTLLYPDRSVQHAGVVIGARGTADHVMRYFPHDVDGYAGSLPCAREVSAVTAACLMMPRSLFDRIGQFSLDYSKHYQDVDLCLRIRELGKRIICNGNVQLFHHESMSRRSEGYDMGDRALLIDRWHELIIEGDPYFNPHFSLERLDYSLR